MHVLAADIPPVAASKHTSTRKENHARPAEEIWNSLQYGIRLIILLSPVGCLQISHATPFPSSGASNSNSMSGSSLVICTMLPPSSVEGVTCPEFGAGAASGNLDQTRR